MMMSELLFCYYIHNAAGEVKGGSFLSFFPSSPHENVRKGEHVMIATVKKEEGKVSCILSVCWGSNVTGTICYFSLLLFLSFSFCTHQSENELNVDIPTATIQCSINSKTKTRTEERETWEVYVTWLSLLISLSFSLSNKVLLLSLSFRMKTNRNETLWNMIHGIINHNLTGGGQVVRLTPGLDLLRRGAVLSLAGDRGRG